ncbi:hypothetical protein [Acetobacterium sp.]|uniref:hypothetical protein n=1 Tax=Acetobacterium sp. TaxID=1872094 RepID=UPI003593D583
MSDEATQKYLFDSEVYFKLKEAELEAQQTSQRYLHKVVFADLKKILEAKVEAKVEYRDDL